MLERSYTDWDLELIVEIRRVLAEALDLWCNLQTLMGNVLPNGNLRGLFLYLKLPHAGPGFQRGKGSFFLRQEHGIYFSIGSTSLGIDRCVQLSRQLFRALKLACW